MHDHAPIKSSAQPAVNSVERDHEAKSREMEPAAELRGREGNARENADSRINGNGFDRQKSEVHDIKPGPSFSLNNFRVHPESFHAVQPKLKVNKPGDAYEQEAESIAEKIMRMQEGVISPVKPSQLQHPPINGTFTEREEIKDPKEKDGRQPEPIHHRIMGNFASGGEDEKVKRGGFQRNVNQGRLPAISDSVEQALQTQGQPLDVPTRAFMEQRFGLDFGKVRIHNDAVAHRSAKEINALAYTHGNHVVFGEGQHRPGSHDGRSLLAHELVHVVQQGAATNSVVQRDSPTPDLIIQDPGTTLDENLFFLNYTADSNVTRLGVMSPGALKVYNVNGKEGTKLIKTYKIKSSVKPPPFLYILQHDGFYIYGYDTVHEKEVFIGKRSKDSAPEAMKILQEWGSALTVDNWFENESDRADFVTNHQNGQFFGLWVLDPSLSGSSAGGEGEPVPPKPEWMPAWEKIMNKAIKDLRASDVVSTDIPDIFGFYYSRSRLKWRAVAEMTFEKKKIQVFLDIFEKDKPAEKLQLIRDKIRIKQLTPESEAKSKEAKELAEELSWAYRIKLELDQKITLERIAHKDSAELPDSTAIVTMEDHAGKAFLKLSVYVSEVIEPDKPTAEPKTRSILKTGVLPQPLDKATSVDDLFAVVRKATLALRGKEYKQASANPEKADTILEPFPATIAIPAGRDDFKTVTGASLDALMRLNMSVVVGDNTLHQTTIAYHGIYYTWDIYRVNDLVSADEAKQFDADWVKRRTQLISTIKDSGRMKAINPVLKEDKLKELNDFYHAAGADDKMIDTSKPLAPDVLNTLRSKELTYGSATKLTPEATLKLPSSEGEYIIYCRAVTEPTGKIFRLPSEAFYAIKVVDGYSLAEESRDASLREIESLKKSKVEAEDDQKKAELEQQITEIETREKTTLGARTANDFTEVTRTKRLANRLLQLYKENANKKVSLASVISKEPEADSEDLFKIWFTVETTDRGTPSIEKVQKMITQLELQLKGLKVLQQSVADFAGDMAVYKGGTYTPVASLVSKVTGEVYSLITMLAIKDEPGGGTSVILVDVTSKQTQGKYYGQSAKSKENGGLEEAIQSAFDKFGQECKYGDGFIAFRVPGTPVKSRAVSKPGFKQKVLEALGYIAMAAGIAALVVGTVASGGTLGLAAFALGIGAGAIGAGLAVHNIHDRYVNHRLEADVELAMDILNIAGPFLQGAAALSKISKLGQVAKIGQAIKAGTMVEDSAETIASVAKLHKLVQLDKAFAILQKAEASINLSLVGYKTFKDMAAIAEAYPNDPKKRTAMQWEVLKNAALAGTLAMVAFRNEFKPTTKTMSALELMVNSGSKEGNYIQLMIKSGMFDPNGKWNDPALRSLEDSAAGQKQEGDGAVKPPDSSTKPPEAGVKPPEAEVKPVEPEVKKPVDGDPIKPPVEDATTAKPKEEIPDTAVKPSTPEGQAPVADIPSSEATTSQTAKPKASKPKASKSKSPKAKIPALEVDKPSTMPDGSVATLKADGSVIIVSRIGKGKGRKGFEKNLLSGIKVGLKGWHRAHSQGQGTGSESPHGIFYAPPEVNLGFQNSGIEARIREIFRITPPGFELTLTTVTKPHPDAAGLPSQRLAGIDYRIEISEPGGVNKHLVLEAGIKVEDKLQKPKVEVHAESFAADALWSIRYGSGTELSMSPSEFSALKQKATALEKELNELIGRLEGKLKTSKGGQQKIDQFHLDRFKELRDSLYEHPDMVPSIKAEIEEAQALWYPKEPLISADAQSYLKQWKLSINRGSKEHVNRLLELSGSWKELMQVLHQDVKANNITIKVLGKYREKIVAGLKKNFQADTLPGASTKPESDIDLNITGVDAGAKLIAAEKQMKAEYGDNWSAMFRLNFYTEGDRLLRYVDVKGKMGPEAAKQFEKDLTRRSIQLNLAKMLQHAHGDADGTARINKLMKLLPESDLAMVKTMSDADPGAMRAKRDQLMGEVDALQKELSAMDVNDPARIEKSKLVTLKQMEINFYSEEAYIGPGAMMSGGDISGNPALKIQKVISNLEMMEHIIHQANGNIITAAKEYELYKYMFRVSEAIGASQQDLFFDYLNKQIYKVDREGAKSMTPGQLQNLYLDFMRMANDYLAKEIVNVL